jgi:hypothetical protein
VIAFIRFIHRLEVVCVAIATTVATGVVGGANEAATVWLHKRGIGVPVDRIGGVADVLAGTMYVYGLYRRKRGQVDH